MMEPVLDELRKEYEGKLHVVFINIGENPNASEEYNIQLIPTQIFFDPSEKELFRHEGFFGKEEILKKWKELGFPLKEEHVEEK